MIENENTSKNPTNATNNQNEKEIDTKLKELEQKFYYLAQEMSKTYLDNTSKRHRDIEQKISEFVKSAEKKIHSQCEDKINLVLSISENEPLVNETNGQVLVSIKPKRGKEEEYTLYTTQLTQCARPYLSLAEQVLEYRNFFKQLNNYAYSFCLNECKSDLIRKYKEGKVNYESVKYCLKDCYNLGSFNFKAYFDYVSEGVEINSKALEKL